jgi:hypothetical protein
VFVSDAGAPVEDAGGLADAGWDAGADADAGVDAGAWDGGHSDAGDAGDAGEPPDAGLLGVLRLSTGQYTGPRYTHGCSQLTVSLEDGDGGIVVSAATTDGNAVFATQCLTIDAGVETIGVTIPASSDGGVRVVKRSFTEGRLRFLASAAGWAPGSVEVDFRWRPTQLEFIEAPDAAVPVGRCVRLTVEPRGGPDASVPIPLIARESIQFSLRSPDAGGFADRPDCSIVTPGTDEFIRNIPAVSASPDGGVGSRLTVYLHVRQAGTLGVSAEIVTGDAGSPWGLTAPRVMGQAVVISN